MKIHVLLDAEFEVIAYVPVRDTDAVPQVVFLPLDEGHTVYEHVEVPDHLAGLRGAEAVDLVRIHLERHLAT